MPPFVVLLAYTYALGQTRIATRFMLLLHVYRVASCVWCEIGEFWRDGVIYVRISRPTARPLGRQSRRAASGERDLHSEFFFIELRRAETILRGASVRESRLTGG